MSDFTFGVKPPQLGYFSIDGKRDDGALSIAAGLRENIVGPVDGVIKLPLTWADTVRDAQLAAGVRYNRDSNVDLIRFFPSVEAGVEVGASSQDRFHTGPFAQLDLVRVGGLTLSGVFSKSFFGGELSVGPQISITLQAGSGSSAQAEAANQEVAQNTVVASVTEVKEREVLPLSAGMDFTSFKNHPQMQEAMATFLGVKKEDVATQFASDPVLKATTPLVAQSPLAQLFEGGAEAVIAVIRLATPDRDQVVDPSDGSVLYGDLMHIGTDLNKRLSRLQSGEVFNDEHFALDGKGEKDLMPQVFTGMYFPKSLFPQMTLNGLSEVIYNHGLYYQWAPSYKVTYATENGFLYFYLEDAIDAQGMDWGRPIEQMAGVYANGWLPTAGVIDDYQNTLAQNLEKARKETGESLQPSEVKLLYGGWIHIPLKNGDIYSSLYSYAKPNLARILLIPAVDKIKEETRHTFVRYAHGLASRVEDPQWKKPKGKDWKMPHFKLGEGEVWKSLE